MDVERKLRRKKKKYVRNKVFEAYTVRDLFTVSQEEMCVYESVWFRCVFARHFLLRSGSA